MTTAISLENIDFAYHDKSILTSLNLSFKQGELTCLLGPNGAGKTTLINLMLGRMPPSTGNIRWFDNITSISQVNNQIGAMLQNSMAPDKARVIELIELFSSYYPSPITTDVLIAELNLQPIIDKRFKLLSGGQKQLVLFALALCGDPKLLFLDEPTVGMDVDVRRTLWSTIEKLKKRGKTIVLTTHYLAEADALADRIVVLDQGKVLADNTPEKIKENLQQKAIKAQSTKKREWLLELPEVIEVNESGKYWQVITHSPEATLKHWLVNDPAIENLTVSDVDLEQAFLHLTQHQLAAPLSVQPSPTNKIA